MKRFSILITACFLLLFSVIAVPTQAQTTAPADNHTAREEAAGKEIWEKLQARQLECKNLTDDNFGSLGEYFMGQMVGSSHEAMNTMMENMLGKVGEEQMHVVMGKRLSGCDTSAQFPQSGIGFMPMMWMMRGGGNPMMGSGWNWNNMIGGWGGFGVLGWFSVVLFWILLILGVVALIRYLSLGKRGDEGKSPLDILKERYARGEIGKKEFEEMKKNLG